MSYPTKRGSHPETLPLVRLIFTVFACASFSLVCSAQPFFRGDRIETDAGRVEITMSQSVKRHPSRANILNICRVTHPVKGCTDFPKESLAAACERRGSSWVINTSASIQAVIHLSDRFKSSHVPILMHEQKHLTGLEESLREHLERIAARRYSSLGACKTFARLISDTPHLRVVMNNLRVESNAEFR